MPYPRNDALPTSVKVLPEDAQTIFRNAFNSAFKEYDGDEQTSNKVAWAAVKRVYEKNEAGSWVKRETIKSFVILQSFSPLALDEATILDIVGGETLARLKAMDPHPYFQAYSVCHEGTSHPTILGDEPKPIHWFRAAVQTMKNAVVKGVKFFLGHNDDNSTAGRDSLGEVVGNREMEIEGQLHHVVVGYFPEPEKVKDLDICSQESEWDLIQTARGWIADKIEKLTAIALSSSKRDKPAFSGAVRLGIVQAFDNNTDDPLTGGRTQDGSRRYPMDLSQATFPELLAELQKRNVRPNQAFTKEQIEADPAFAPVFEKAKAHDDLKKTAEELKTKLDAETADKEKVNGELKSVKRANEFVTAKPRLEKLMKAENFTAEQAAFVVKRFTDKVEDLTDDGLKKFAQEQVTIYKDAIGDSTQSTTGGEGADSSGAGASTDPTDLTKKVNNPMLKADLE